MKLTDAFIRNLTLDGSKTRYFDDAIPNFGVRVYKTHIGFFIRVGKSRKAHTLGRYPQLTLKEARQKALTVLDAQSPHQPPKTPQTAILSFLEACEARNKPRTVQDYTRLLKRFPETWDKQDILTTLTAFRSTPGEQSHLSTAFNVFLYWCVHNGIIEQNPIAGLRNQGRINKRDRILTDDELVTIWNNATEYPFGHIVRLLITTGQRRSEIGKMECDFIHHDHITFPTGYTKNSKEHTFPIGPLTNQILLSMPDTKGLVFGTFNGWAKKKRQLALNLPHFTLHDLRRTFASNHARIGTPIHLIERLLNHTPAGVHWVYNRHSYQTELRLACDSYENWLQSLLLRA